MSVVLVHGGGMGAWAWNELIVEIDRRSRGAVNVLAVDVPGCGAKRDRDIDALDNENIAAELVEEIRSSGLRDVVLVGHSQAGQLIPFMVEFAPELFSRLVYVSCSAPDPGRSITDTMGQGPQGVHEDQIGWPADELATPMLELFRAMFCNDMAPDQQEVFLGKLLCDTWPPPTYSFSEWRYGHLRSVPATYVVCLRDQVLPPVWQRRFAATLFADRTVDIDAGHQAMNTQPDRLAAILLDEIEAASRPSSSTALTIP